MGAPVAGNVWGTVDPNSYNAYGKDTMGQISGGIDASKGVMSGAGAAGNMMQTANMGDMFAGMPAAAGNAAMQGMPAMAGKPAMQALFGLSDIGSGLSSAAKIG